MKDFYRITNKKRLIALVVLFAVLAIAVFSSGFVIREAKHDCCGADCKICAMIEQCKATLKEIGIGQISIIVVVAAISYFFQAICFAFSAIAAETLITRKVRLNN